MQQIVNEQEWLDAQQSFLVKEKRLRNSEMR